VVGSSTRYLKSLALELNSQARRVRDLIGSRHWLTDGAHKEYLLAEIIRRHAPAGYGVARGFVVSSVHADLCSREQDILVIDTTQEAPVFNQGGVVIAFPGSVRAAVSVKTNLGSEEVADSIATLRSVTDVVIGSSSDAARVWCGAFFFDPSDAVSADPSKVYGYIAKAVQDLNGGRSHRLPDPCPDLLATAEDLLFRQYREDEQTGKVVGFRCGGLASAIFLARLLDHLATERGAHRAEFADFASVPAVEPLDKSDHTFSLLTERS
jgi:hypothetical protein